MLRSIESKLGRPLNLRYAEVRPGDQPLYISDTGKIERHTGWRPRRSLPDILASIRSFWDENETVIRAQQHTAPAVEMLAQEVA